MVQNGLGCWINKIYTFDFLKDDANHDPQWSTEQIISAKLTYPTEKGTITIGTDLINLMLEQTRTIFEVLERAWRAKDCTLVDMKIEFGVDVETGQQKFPPYLYYTRAISWRSTAALPPFSSYSELDFT